MDIESITDNDGSSPAAVYPLIQKINQAIKRDIDTNLSWDQLNEPGINFTVIRPLLLEFSEVKEPAVIYALLLNRIQFQRLSTSDLAFASLQTTRANACELLALKLIRSFSSSDLELVQVLTHPYSPFDGAPSSLMAEIEDDLEDVKSQNALEVAVLSAAKHFLATPLLTRSISLVSSGAIVYQSQSSSSLLSDNYKSAHRLSLEGNTGGSPHAVWAYDPWKAGWLDHSRLKVPAWRNVIERLNFVLLAVVFCWCLGWRDLEKVTVSEAAFWFVSLGILVDEFASSKEHGFAIYSANVYNGFDMCFILIVLSYLLLRVKGLVTGDAESSDLAFDLLSTGAVVLFPRIAFGFIDGNVVILALKLMIIDFCKFMAFATVCFSGLYFALLTLGRGVFTPRALLWLMVQIWFGNTFLSFSQAKLFNPIIGPIIMVCFAAASGTLLVTILISILSNRFAEINSSAHLEMAYQSTIDVVAGVKSDSIFSFIVPFNLPCLLILRPLSFLLSPRAFHRYNVFAIRLTSFPLLIFISNWERHIAKKPTAPHVRNVFELFEVLTGNSSDWVLAKLFDEDLESPSEILLEQARQLLEDEGESTASTSTTVTPASAIPPNVSGHERTTSMSTSRSISSSPRKRVKPFNPTRPAIEQMPGSIINGSATGGYNSPLARLFGRSGTSGDLVGDAQPPSPRDPESAKEVEKLREELKAMAKRQERMEEMLVMLTKGLRKGASV